MKNVIIIGTGGHAKVVSDIVGLSGDNVFGFLTADLSSASFLNRPVLGLDSDFEKYPDCFFIIAVGNQYIREKLCLNMKNCKWYTAIHPRAVISETADVGEGSVICAGAVINPAASVGRHCIINTGAVVEHDDKISDFVHVSVGAHLAGNVKIGARTMLGIGSCVRNNIAVCNDCVIGAGAVVVKNITEEGTYIGIPAKKTV